MDVPWPQEAGDLAPALGQQAAVKSLVGMEINKIPTVTKTAISSPPPGIHLGIQT